MGDDTEEALEGELTYRCDYAVGKDVGEYDIVPSGLTAKNGNYTITYIPGKLNVTQASPEPSIENLSVLDRVYDAAAPEPEVRSDSDGALTVTFMRGNELIPNAPYAVGSYRVIVNTEATKNYQAGNKEFSFEIRKAPLTITAKDLRIPVSSEIPEYEAVYEGFAGADNVASLGGKLQFTCRRALSVLMRSCLMVLHPKTMRSVLSAERLRLKERAEAEAAAEVKAAALTR